MVALGYRECWMDILPSFKEASGVVSADATGIDGKMSVLRNVDN